ncbi:MAG: hypothetical protein JO250_13580 [Armatimonadetes bacterium]|nr:hypothetical protein [Armatimonadota bacterium]
MSSTYYSGPKTPKGKAVAARNATTHGLFARDIVLTHLGESAEGYEALLAHLTAQINPANLLETHYAEKIAAASWRLRRLQRWQAQLFEDPQLSEDERLDKLDKVLRHETALHRQIDTAVKMLARDVPRLFHARAREAALAEQDLTERDCKEDPDLELEVARQTRQSLRFAPPPDLDSAALDNVHAPEDESQNCQNEPAEVEEEETAPDINYVHPDGRPVYLEPRVWKNILYCRAHGEEAQAEEWDRHYRQCYLEDYVWAAQEDAEDAEE